VFSPSVAVTTYNPAGRFDTFIPLASKDTFDTTFPVRLVTVILTLFKSKFSPNPTLTKSFAGFGYKVKEDLASDEKSEVDNDSAITVTSSIDIKSISVTS